MEMGCMPAQEDFLGHYFNFNRSSEISVQSVPYVHLMTIVIATDEPLTHIETLFL